MSNRVCLSMLPLEPPQLRISREGFKCDTEAENVK